MAMHQNDSFSDDLWANNCNFMDLAAILIAIFKVILFAWSDFGKLLLYAIKHLQPTTTARRAAEL